MAISIIFHGDIIVKLKTVFYIYDLNKDGVIDEKEMRKIITFIYDLINEQNRDGLNSPSVRVKDIMRKLDKNRDSKITCEEFIQGCLDDENLKELLTSTLISSTKEFKPNNNQ